VAVHGRIVVDMIKIPIGPVDDRNGKYRSR
jgi:hypothetical protein